ncbi:NAD-dependent epimerase/dehydratase family protein [Salipiger bermudensis]|uniref:NAD-dependent epimerase/dehydratase family protein n=1 Tax=Salipiger bermudensis TaxID=344736 RepID=UPI001CD47FBC|nr:NAD-dependent epimerase/dehydratase family protein [Salipiger bermudensis]MCA0964729.1 NAD-dependent epimerase/dehydratase family protein [Salipiger bermudensis]
MDVSESSTFFITGAAGFIGYHLCKSLLNEGYNVVGLDALTNYYDISLKENRLGKLQGHPRFTFVKGRLEEHDILAQILEIHKPEYIIHLAAQAGVRYSIEAPKTYVDSNLVGTFELLEAARNQPPKHLLLASTSSIFGANTEMPYKEVSKADHQMSFYAATKKANEAMAHSYAHLFDLPVTMFRFFTVYGPWGRPDMALFKFTKAMLKGDPIDIYNNGEMKRDFTYIDDLVFSVRRLISCPPGKMPVDPDIDSKSPVAPFRIVNIGNSQPAKLMDFVSSLEKSLGMEAKKNFLPMQAGDVPATWADTSLLKKLVGDAPHTNLDEGVSKFVEWYKSYYHI